jgi:hypothetical protein
LTELRVYESSRVCLALYVPPTGFGYPLGGLLLAEPLSHFFRLKRSWVCSFRVLLPMVSRASLKALLLSCPFIAAFTRRLAQPLELQSFAPTIEPYSPQLRLGYCGNLDSLGVTIFEVLSPVTLSTSSGSQLFCTLSTHTPRHEQLYFRVFVLQAWLNLREICRPL